MRKLFLLKVDKYKLRVYRLTVLAILMWTIIIGFSLLWNISRENSKVIDLARVEADANLKKDRAFRLWASEIGKIYIGVNEIIRPNPYLAHIPDRDIITQNGKKLTLINPGTIVTNVSAKFKELYGIKTKITGKVYLNPLNKPDKWENEALDKLSQDVHLNELIETVEMDGKPYLRMIQPIYMQETCLKCHGITNIKVGELRGATDVAIPLEPYKAILNSTIKSLEISYAFIWSLGLGVIVLFSYRSIEHEKERLEIENELIKVSHAVEQSASCVMITDSKGNIQYVNQKFTEITGYKSSEVIGMNPNILKSGETDLSVYETMWSTLLAGNEWHGEFKNRRKNGEIFWSMESISCIKNQDGFITHFVAMFEDINDRKMTEHEIRKLAYYDPLTELPNRRYFHEQLDHVARWTNRANGKIALFYIDLDRFKNTNDTLGHTVGDQLLITMANRLTNCLRESDMVFRLGGDEFAIIAPNLQKNEDAIKLVEKIIDSIRQPMAIGEYELYITTSVGISLYPNDTDDLDELVKNADIALYHAKEKGKNTFQFYSEKINALTIEHLQVENDLRRAIDRNEFFLEYQPQVNLKSGKVYGVEALLRWRHATLGLIPPEKFIPLAEETNLILPIGEWVLKTACKQLKIWDSKNLSELSLAINLSAVQFRQGTLLHLTKKTLRESGIDFHRLELEITESALMKNPDETGNILKSLTELGIKVSIDDFGTGYSSLGYLKKFPISILKIDKSFVDDIVKRTEDQAIAKAVIALAEGMNLQVMAEGVETLEQIKMLTKMNCTKFQGYIFSEPLHPDKLESYIADFKQKWI